MISSQTFRNRTVRILASGILCASVVVASGCYGRFPATNALYDWNGEATDNHIVNSVIMVGLAIIPVYGLCILVDAVVLNSIEYWNGDYPANSFLSSVELEDGTMMAVAPGEKENESIMTVSRNGETIATATYQRIDEMTTNVLDEKGRIVSVIERRDNGDMIVSDGNGKVLNSYSSAELASLAESRKAIVQ